MATIDLAQSFLFYKNRFRKTIAKYNLVDSTTQDFDNNEFDKRKTALKTLFFQCLKLKYTHRQHAIVHASKKSTSGSKLVSVE